MITWTQYILNLKNNIQGHVPAFMERELAVNALALIRQRIAQRGETAGGDKFKPYSTRPILVGASSFVTQAAREKVFGSKQKRRGLEWRTVGGHRLAILPGGYAQVREIEGRQTQHKDFERTSEMWKSIHVLGVEQAANNYTANIGSRVPLTLQKLEGHDAREGAPVLALSDKELGWLTEDFMKELKRIIDQT